MIAYRVESYLINNKTKYAVVKYSMTREPYMINYCRYHIFAKFYCWLFNAGFSV